MFRVCDIPRAKVEAVRDVVWLRVGASGGREKEQDRSGLKHELSISLASQPLCIIEDGCTYALERALAIPKVQCAKDQPTLAALVTPRPLLG